MHLSAFTINLVIFGACLMLTAIICGIRLKKRIPRQLQDKWLFLVLIMGFFFSGHLLFAFLLLRQFPFPNILIAISIVLGSSFSLLVIALTRGALKEFQEEALQLSIASDHIRRKDLKLSQETAVRLKTEQKLEKADAFFIKELFEMIGEVLANRDQYTFEHDMQVAAISLRIGEKLGLSKETLSSLELGCLAHDIGKTAIPDDVLLKPARFNLQDRNIMEYHPLIGAKLVARHIQDDMIIDIILNHHERLDGSGYPAGLKGDEIGLLPRIVAAADTYEALVSRRPYKKSISSEEALAVLRREAELGKLDKNVVDTLITIIADVPETLTPSVITAGFMKDVELFRNRAYFREPLSDFYNYRYLLFLDDAGVLGKDDLPYELILVSFPNFGALQQDTDYLVADQVFDEIGQMLADICHNSSQKRDFYDGSVMLFRKRNDYLIYQEGGNNTTPSSTVFDEISKSLTTYEQDWGLNFILIRQPFRSGMATSQALHDLLAKAKPTLQEKNLDNDSKSA
ncbi:MAG: HD domain-containing protein [Proteobacteria bacterium]|nr:HD domain-containing protein [Pseudomonadota bacterium]